MESQPSVQEPAESEGLPYLRLELEIEPADGVAGPPFPAPLFRRVLARALVDTFCLWAEPYCQTGPASQPARDRCRLAEHCPYGVLVAASLTPRPPMAIHLHGGGTGPGSAERTGRRLEVTLYGPAWRHYGWVVAAFDRAFARGLGRDRRRLRIRQISRASPDGGRRVLATNGSGSLSKRLPADLEPDLCRLSLSEVTASDPVTVRLESPARLLADGRLIAGHEGVPFAVLVARILDRVAGLFGPLAADLLDLERRAQVEAEAKAVPLLADETRWLEVEDYSARKRAELLLGGKVGRLVYGPGATRFLPILRAGEIVHVGKNPTAGCGRISVGSGSRPVH